MKDHVSERSKSLTRVFSTFVHVVMSLSLIWYNFIVQWYYIVHLKSKTPTAGITDKYFPFVYYTTMALNEAYFVLLLLIGFVMNKFVKARFRRATTKLRSSSGQIVVTRSNSEATMYIKQVSSP